MCSIIFCSLITVVIIITCNSRGSSIVVVVVVAVDVAVAVAVAVDVAVAIIIISNYYGLMTPLLLVYNFSLKICQILCELSYAMEI